MHDANLPDVLVEDNLDGLLLAVVVALGASAEQKKIIPTNTWETNY